MLRDGGLVRGRCQLAFKHQVLYLASKMMGRWRHPLALKRSCVGREWGGGEDEQERLIQKMLEDSCVEGRKMCFVGPDVRQERDF